MRSARKRPTIHDVASAAGVSIKTVSRVVNNVSTVDTQIAERVREAIRTTGYRPNQLASTLKSGSATSMIGLVLKDISNEFYASITLGVSSVAHAHSAQLIAAASDEDIDAAQELELIFDLCKRRVDGLIVIPRGGDYSRLATEVEMGTPMVFLDRRGEGLDVDSVVLDNFGGSREAIKALIAKGHRRIGLLFHSQDLFQIQQRYDGAMSAMTDAGLEVDPGMVVFDLFGPETARASAEKMLDADDPPTAIFCANNRLTEGAIEAVWRRHSNTVIAGFDDFRFSAMMPVPLVLVSYDAREYGRVAADMLFRRIAGDVGPVRSVIIPTRIIETGRPVAR